MDYKALIQKYCPECIFNAPANDADIVVLERGLGIEVPDTYRSILKQFNGFQRHGAKYVFSTDEAIQENIEFQKIPDSFPDLYMDLSAIYAFGEAGNGDYFFFPKINGKIEDWKIYRWDHEDDSRISVRYHFQNFIPTLFQDASFVAMPSCKDNVTGTIVTVESNRKRLFAIDTSGKMIWNEYVYDDVPFDAFGNQPLINQLFVDGETLKVHFVNGQIKTLSFFTGKPV